MLFFLAIILALQFAFPSSVLAQNSLDPCTPGSDIAACDTSELEIGPVLGTVIQFIFVIAVILSLGFLVYGGIRWITSGGDKGGVETARNTIIASIIGLILVFLSYFILNFVLSFLTGEDIGKISIPNLKDLQGQDDTSNPNFRNFPTPIQGQGAGDLIEEVSYCNSLSTGGILPPNLSACELDPRCRVFGSDDNRSCIPG